MTAFAPQTLHSPDNVLRLPEDGLYELVDGALVEKQMGSEASEVAWIIGSHLFIHISRFGGGKCYPEQAFQCFPNDPALVRRPDLAFVAAHRVADVDKEGNVKIAPTWQSKSFLPLTKFMTWTRS